MIDNIRFVEKTLLQSTGGSLKDLENTNYWELMKIMGTKDPHKSDNNQRSNSNTNAFDFLKRHPIN